MAECVWRNGGWVAQDAKFSDEQMLEMEIKFKELFDKADDFQDRKNLAELAAFNDIELVLEKRE